MNRKLIPKLTSKDAYTISFVLSASCLYVVEILYLKCGILINSTNAAIIFVLWQVMASVFSIYSIIDAKNRKQRRGAIISLVGAIVVLLIVFFPQLLELYYFNGCISF